MSLPELVTVHTSLLTDLGDAVRERFGVSGDLTIEEMTDVVLTGLPAAYQQVDYIESTGTQWINTAFYATNDTEFEAKISNLTVDNSDTIIGCTNYSGTVKYDVLIYNQNWYLDCGNGGSSGIAVVQADEYVVSYKNKIFKVNEAQVSFTGNLSKTTYSLGLLARKSSASGVESGTQMKCRLHYIKIWNADTTAYAYLVPCYRKSDKVIGMYDFVEGQFYTNAGSGSFTCYPSPT